MSKSIYEELLEIIDRNIFELPMGFAVLYEIRKKIEQAFKQAQKQKKLLELYKELIILYKQFIFNIEIGDYKDKAKYYKSEIFKIKQRIKELENE